MEKYPYIEKKNLGKIDYYVWRKKNMYKLW